jgi:uncharacterized membrane protein YbhN (UPF0104 family)
MSNRLSLLGLAVSVIALAAVVWWAIHQEPPQLPDSPGELGALIGAIALYGVATVLRAERWHHLLLRDGAQPHRADCYALTVVGYAGNNVLPARAGDPIRVVLMAPRAATSKRTVIGTLLAERLLDIVVIVALFVVVGYAVLGEVGAGSVQIIAAVTAGVIALAALALVLLRRNERLHDFVAPMLSSTLALRGRHGLWLLTITVVVWLIEGAVWMSVGASVGFGMDPIEGLYLVALASVFALIPSGPGYAGTQDAAAVVGIRAVGGSGATAVSYLVMLRFVLLVPITLLGLVLMAVRYGGIARLRRVGAEARA